MKFYVTENYEQMSRKAASILAAKVIEKPDCVLGLATGSTPIGTYQNLIAWYQSGDLDFSQVKSVNLDEYVGLAPTHDQSYRYFMNDNLFNHIDIDIAKTHVPDGLAEDGEAAGKAYDELVASLGYADLQLLGLGHNGHIGFNEPGDSFIAPTHAVELSEKTRIANARFFDGDMDKVPTHAITMGIRSIMQAKKVILAVSGPDKMETLKKAIYGPITPEVQASILQLHKDLTVIYCENP